MARDAQCLKPVDFNWQCEKFWHVVVAEIVVSLDSLSPNTLLQNAEANSNWRGNSY